MQVDGNEREIAKRTDEEKEHENDGGHDLIDACVFVETLAVLAHVVLIV